MINFSILTLCTLFRTTFNHAATLAKVRMLIFSHRTSWHHNHKELYKQKCRITAAPVRHLLLLIVWYFLFLCIASNIDFIFMVLHALNWFAIHILFFLYNQFQLYDQYYASVGRPSFFHKVYTITLVYNWISDTIG